MSNVSCQQAPDPNPPLSPKPHNAASFATRAGSLPHLRTLASQRAERTATSHDPKGPPESVRKRQGVARKGAPTPTTDRAQEEKNLFLLVGLLGCASMRL